MKLVNATPRGATVFITDLKIRVGQQSAAVNRADAIASADLRWALDKGMVRLEVANEERGDPAISELLIFAAFADAKREGRSLFAQAEGVMKSGKRIDYSLEVPIRPAVFEPVS